MSQMSRKTQRKRATGKARNRTAAKKSVRRPLGRHARRQRVAILLSLEKLSKPLQSDVLADGSIARQFDLGVTNTVHLGTSLSVSRDKIFAAFREASRRTTPVKLKGEDGAPTDAKVTLDQRGTGCITV